MKVLDALVGLPPAPLLKVVLYVYGFIALCSAVSVLHPALRKPERRPVRQAINSWWFPALVGGLAVCVGGAVALLIFGVVSAWALSEFLKLLPEDARRPEIEALAYTAVLVHYADIALYGAAPHDGLLLFWIFAILPLAHAALYGPTGILGGIGALGLGLLLTTFSLGHVARFFFLPAHVGPVGPAGFAALLMLGVMTNDAGQYVSGKLAGRHRMAPILSPKKTWEGLIGGVTITALVAALAAPSLSPFSRIEGALVGVGLALLGVLGDLLVSALKRDAGVKDSGTVLPGQGGLLDRTDSLLLSAPLFFYAVERYFV